MTYRRREVLKLGLGALPAAHLFTRPGLLHAAARPDSRIGGVQIGIIAPYAFRGTAGTAEEILDAVVALGIGAVELQNDPVEAYAGAPESPRRRMPPRRPAGGGPPQRREPTPEERAAREAYQQKVREWRLAAPMDRFAARGEVYRDAGVRIYAFKLALTEDMPDEEYDYTFSVAKALGASHLTMELNDNTERIGKFAAKHEVYVAYHNHTQVDESSWDAALAQSPWNGINLDCGHMTAAIGKSPIPFIEKHHARIHSMHLKDRRYGKDGDNLPWGQGDTPLVEVLKLMKREQYSFPATIELEYPVPEGSDVTTELKKCLAYCREALA